MLSLSIEGDNDLYLNDFLNARYAVRYSIFTDTISGHTL